MLEFIAYVQYRDNLVEDGSSSLSSPNDQQVDALARQTQAEVGKTKTLLASKPDPAKVKQQMDRVNKLQQSLSQINQQRTLTQAMQDADKAISQNKQNNPTNNPQQSFIGKNVAYGV